MLDFGVLPPEITSTNMYFGPGSGPLMAAASAWDSLVAQLESFATGYSSAIAGLQSESWTGPAAESMAVAAAPYAEWATNTGVQAGHAAGQARAAAAAYESAHAATVPPQLVTANRTQLVNLVASNIFGQNTPHIALNESEYAGMWAQNTHTMFGYASSASSATQLSPFTQPPETTNPAGGAAQAAAMAGAGGGSGASNLSLFSQLLSALPQQLQGLSTAGGSNSSSALTSLLAGLGDSKPFSGVSAFNTLAGPEAFAGGMSRTMSSMGSFGIAANKAAADAAKAAAPAAAAAPPPPPPVAPAASMAGAGESAAAGARNAVLASLGEAGSVGQLSTPHAWANATPVAAFSEESSLLSDVEAATPSWDMEPAGAAPAAGMGPMTGAAGAAAGAAAGRASVSNVLRVGPRRFKMPRHSAGG